MKLSFGNFKKFFGSLKGNITAKEILLDLSHSFNETETIVQKVYDLNVPGALKGDTLDLTTTIILKELDSSKKTLHATFAACIETMLKNQDPLMDVIKEEFNPDNIVAVMDYYKLNLIKYVEAVNFFNDYSRRWINVVLWETLIDSTQSLPLNKDESMAPINADPARQMHLLSGPMHRADLEFVRDDNNMHSLIPAINMLSMPLSAYLKTINDLKGHQYSDSDWEGERDHTFTRKVDKFNSNFIPVMWNPVYHIGLAVNGWRAAKNERNKLELSKMQLTIMAIEESKRNQTNPETIQKLSHQIEYYNNEVNKLDAKIKRFEGE